MRKGLSFSCVFTLKKTDHDNIFPVRLHLCASYSRCNLLLNFFLLKGAWPCADEFTPLMSRLPRQVTIKRVISKGYLRGYRQIVANDLYFGKGGIIIQVCYHIFSARDLTLGPSFLFFGIGIMSS